MPPPVATWSRAVSRKFSDDRCGVAASAEYGVGRYSEKHSRAGTCRQLPLSPRVGQKPVAALVLLARICAMSGNVRLGLVVARFSPAEL